MNPLLDIVPNSDPRQITNNTSAQPENGITEN